MGLLSNELGMRDLRAPESGSRPALEPKSVSIPPLPDKVRQPSYNGLSGAIIFPA